MNRFAVSEHAAMRYWRGKSPSVVPQYGMANGQVVLVTTEGLTGGPPMRTVYYVAEEDPIKAEAIIAKIMAPNEKVQAFGLLPDAAAKALGINARSVHQRMTEAVRSRRLGRGHRILPGPAIYPAERHTGDTRTCSEN